MKKIEEILSNKKVQVVLLILYSMVIIYFLFFAFNRVQRSHVVSSYRYSLKIKRIPLWIPSKQYGVTKSWIFSMGNLMAFIPLGILISMVFDFKLFKTLLSFVISITILEYLQMITYRGSFDVEDILINSIGVLIGYIAYKLGLKFKNKRILWTSIISIVLVILSIILADFINMYCLR